MDAEQKLLALEKSRAVIQATLDYLIERVDGNVDQTRVALEYYAQQKTQAQKYFETRRLDKLLQQQATLINLILVRTDLDFGSHIQERTGYDIDIYDELRQKVDAILAKKEVYKKQDHNDIKALIRYYRHSLPNEGMDEKLNTLLLEYSKMDTSKTPIRKV